MSLFKKRTNAVFVSPYPLDQYEPVIRSSVCTGEMTDCMRNRDTGKLHEVMLIRNSYDMKQFAEQYGADLDLIRTVY